MEISPLLCAGPLKRVAKDDEGRVVDLGETAKHAVVLPSVKYAGSGRLGDPPPS